jgi:hypothetical protein
MMAAGLSWGKPGPSPCGMETTPRVLSFSRASPITNTGGATMTEIICKDGRFDGHKDTVSGATRFFSISIGIGDPPVSIVSHHYKAIDRYDDGRQVFVFDHVINHQFMVA